MALSKSFELEVCVIPVMYNKVPETGARAQGKGNRDSIARNIEIKIRSIPENKIAVDKILFRGRQ
jgi:hypothetical protein